jgi:hypothetical protein
MQRGHHGVRGVELWELLGGITSNRGGSCCSYREAFWLYALPPRMRATHRRAAHATFSRVTAAAGVTVQVVKTGITPQLATSERLRAAKTAPLHPAGRLHMRR